MSSSWFRYSLIIALALAGILAYALIPSKPAQLILWPLADKTPIFVKNDSSTIAQFSKDSTLSIQWTWQGEQPWGVLGIQIAQLSGSPKNWSFWDTLYLDIEADNISEITLKLSTHDPDFTNNQDTNTFRLLVKEFPISNSNTHYAIPMEHFYIPDWWYLQNKVPKDFSEKHLESTIKLEIMPTKFDNTKRSSLIFQNVYVKGHSNFRFGLLLFYLLGLIIVAMGLNTNLRKSNG